MKSISVIIPVYNVVNYLEKCLNSVLSQTFQDFEIIAVDDGSTDGSSDILAVYNQLIPNLQLCTQENAGLSAARNLGLQRATGKYIYFLDSDDFLELDAFEKCFQLAEGYQLDFVKFDARPFSEDRSIIENKYDSKATLEPCRLYRQDEWLETQYRHYNSPVWLFLIRHEIIQTHKLAFQEGLLHEDELFTPQLFAVSDRIMYLDKAFFHRRYRRDSIMGQAAQGNASRQSKQWIVLALDEEAKRARQKSVRRFMAHRRDILYMETQFGHPIPMVRRWFLDLRVYLRQLLRRK
ncbi:glycosyltransferase [Listeria rocourtiae]|uniref:glycosyltransferase n=1 Tax=Listeria rocourtiae TaxID=647910 RepID=UPI001624544F|nr:glycosyltransferase [Listeria rocourtiae]MBC1605510.1 glycosyltransferase [Listeria rocourtiae]